MSPLIGFAAVVEGQGRALHDVIGHSVVDFAGQFDESGGHADFAGLPRQVKRVDGNAVPAQAGAGVERLEAEGLGAGGGDHLPDVDAHGGEHDFHFVDQGDVDGPVNVLQQLGGLGDLG